MKVSNLIMGAAFAILSIFVLIEASHYPHMPGQPYGPATFPTIVAVAMLVGGILLMISGLSDWRGWAHCIYPEPWMRSSRALRVVAAVPLFVVLYIFLADAVGFLILVPVLLTLLLLLTTGRFLYSVAVALTTTAGAWLFFGKLLLVPLPLGILKRILY